MERKQSQFHVLVIEAAINIRDYIQHNYIYTRKDTDIISISDSSLVIHSSTHRPATEISP